MRFLMFSLVFLMLRIVFNVFWGLSSGERDLGLFLFTFHCDGVYISLIERSLSPKYTFAVECGLPVKERLYFFRAQ